MLAEFGIQLGCHLGPRLRRLLRTPQIQLHPFASRPQEPVRPSDHQPHAPRSSPRSSLPAEDPANANLNHLEYRQRAAQHHTRPWQRAPQRPGHSRAQSSPQSATPGTTEPPGRCVPSNCVERAKRSSDWASSSGTRKSTAMIADAPGFGSCESRWRVGQRRPPGWG